MGQGPEPLLAFHGFSEQGSSFMPLLPSFGKKYTIYAFDLPYHGQTSWNNPEHFTTVDLIEIIRIFLEELKLNRFSLLGFSMGGKCAMYLTKYFAPQVNALWLLASDGINTNRIYNVAVYPAWGRELFRTTIKHPGWFFLMVRIAARFGWISPWLKKFTENHMSTAEKRKRLYDTWISMAGFNPDISKVRTAIIAYNIRTILIFGKRDEVILPAVGRQFAEGLPNTTFLEIDGGHYFVDDRLNAVIDGIDL